MTKKNLSPQEVKHVAQLARLKLSQKELAKFQKQLSDILTYVDQLKAIKTKQVNLTSQVTGLENVFRDDQPDPCLSQKEALSEAKNKQNGFFKVKAIFEEI